MKVASAVPECAACTVGPYRSLPPLLMARLTRSRVRFARDPGDVICQQDAPSCNVYCIHSGVVELFQRGNNCREVVIGTRQAGDLVGFEAVLAGLPYTTTALAVEPSVICAIPGTLFLELVERGPELTRCLLTTACKRGIVDQSHFAARTHAHVTERVVGLLLDLGRRASNGNTNGWKLQTSMPRETMARLLDTTPETLSRTLHRLAAMGILELVGRRGIAVRDPSALEALCGDHPEP